MNLIDAMPLSTEGRLQVSSLPGAPTRLSNLGDDVSNELVSWGYAMCDLSVRAKYKGPVLRSVPAWPFPKTA